MASARASSRAPASAHRPRRWGAAAPSWRTSRGRRPQGGALSATTAVGRGTTFFWVVCVLLGLQDRLVLDEGTDVDEAAEPQVEHERVESFPWHPDRGSAPWYTMAFEKWNRIYWRSSKDGPSGVVMLLLERAPGKAGEWTALDPVGRVQLINPKDKVHASTRAKAGVVYTDWKGLSAHDKQEAEQASARLIDRMNGATKTAPK